MAENNVFYLDTIPELTRILGKTTGAQLRELGLETVDDLLHHYPRRYVDRGDLTPLNEGEEGEYLTYVARVKHKNQTWVKNNTLLLTKVVFTDGRNDVTCAFFSKNKYRVNRTVQKLEVGDTAVLTGTIAPSRNYRNDRFPKGRELIHPQVHLLDDPIDPELDPEGAQAQADRPLVLYPSVKGIYNDTIVEAVKTVLGPVQRDEIVDPVPEHVRKKQGLMPLFDAFHQIHMPANQDAARKARETLRFHEAFTLQAVLGRRRMWADSFEATPRPHVPGGFVDALDAQLPFDLTAGQRQVAAEISEDLQRSRPMQRLLQGEVGSGKTVVALRAMLQVADAGGQAALLAPTEVLASQHAKSIETMLGPLAPKVGITLLTGSLPTAQRRQALLDAASGKANIVVGTHALLSENVQFAELGFVIVDEQHRFGVEQRDVLRTKADTVPHYLVMTATPIPRSVAMTVFGDVDTSTLKEMPAGRAEVETHLVYEGNQEWMTRLWQRVAEEAHSGGRAYIVCPRIGDEGENDTDDDALTSVLELAEQLREQPELLGLDVGILHGRLAPEEKDSSMEEFITGRIPVLVSTTVVEVGVDVPDATVMVIMDAHMFGISQLHQLRGRIGRGSRPGVCLVVTDTHSRSAVERLRAFAATRDGFELAELDLTVRKEGDVLGRAQSGGASTLRLLRVMEDTDLIADARTAAWNILEDDPELENHPALASAVARVSAHEDFLDRA